VIGPVDWAAVTAQMRAEGWRWDDIADCVGAPSGDILRKRFARATDGSTEAVPPTPPRLPTKLTLPGRPKILLLPDTQVADGVPLDHFKAAGRYAAAKQVDGVVHIGDFLDYRAISSYNSPRAKEGLRLRDDVDAAQRALALFHEGLGGYKPKHQLITLGNHEDRLNRYIGDHPELEGTLALPAFEGWGWNVYPFLQPVCINGVYFAHYFTRTAKGWAGKNPHPNAQTMVRREMVSCVAGHTPGLDPYIHPAGGGGGLIRGLIAGSFYQHDEKWMGPQGNRYWRGCVMLHDVRDGYFDQMEVSMQYLLEHYGD
jgi:hypothetical protein